MLVAVIVNINNYKRNILITLGSVLKLFIYLYMQSFEFGCYSFSSNTGNFPEIKNYAHY